MTICRLANVCLITLCGTTSATAEDWPMWRGPRGDGISHESVVPLHWSETENVAWKTPVPGTGYSSPVISGDSIFLTSANVETRERLLLCFDRHSGAIRWQHVVAVAEIEQMHRLNSPASGTPATDGEHVFVIFQTGNELLVSAFDFSGDLVWTQVPGRFESRHGFNTSPVIYRDSLLISGMQDGADAFIARLNRYTGEIEWKSNISDPVRSFSTPLLINVAGHCQGVLSGANRTFGFDPEDGRQIWSVQGPAEKTVSSLACDERYIFVAGGRDKMLFAVHPTGTGEVTDTHIQWRRSRAVPYVNSPLAYGGCLHVLSDEGIYSCVDLADGSTLSQRRLGGKWSSSPIGACGRVYLTSESGRTLVFENRPGSDPVADNRIAEPVFASIAVSETDFYLRSEQHLFRITAPVD